MDQTSREPGSPFPGRLVRTRLYEQVAEQITSWIAENGLQPGDRLPPRWSFHRGKLSRKTDVKSTIEEWSRCKIVVTLDTPSNSARVSTESS